MEPKLVKGLFFAGEIKDIDGSAVVQSAVGLVVGLTGRSAALEGALV